MKKTGALTNLVKPGLGGGFDLWENLWRIAAALAILLGANLAFYLLFNVPRLRALQNLEERRNASAIELRGSLSRATTMRDKLKEYDEQTSRLDDFYANVLGTQAERMTAIQKGLRNIASEFHIDPESIEYSSQPIEKTDLTEFQVTIPLVGGYPNLRQFINRIESSKNLLIVDSVELTGAREGGAMLSLAIKISTVFRSTPMSGDSAPPPPAGAGG